MNKKNYYSEVTTLYIKYHIAHYYNTIQYNIYFAVYNNYRWKKMMKIDERK